jgi:hypothetical protein
MLRRHREECMTLSRFVFKTHKWLAVAALLATFFWFFSGIVIATPQSLFGSRPFSEKAQPGDRSLRDATLTPAQAIASVDAAAAAPTKINEVCLRKLAGEVIYQISTGSGTQLVNAVDGSLITIDEARALRIVKRFAGENAGTGTATLLREHTGEYRWGPLPAWRVPLQDARGTLFFVATEDGSVSFNDSHGRLRGSLAGWHSFSFLRPLLSERAVRGVMWIFSVAGTAMTLFGLWILWIQWKIWLATRNMRAA